MKQTIRIGVLSGLLMATIPLWAQVAPRDSDAQRGSRLEIGRTPTEVKTVTKPVLSRRFSPVQNPAVSSLDRSVNYQKNTPINAHYRSLLLGKAADKSVTARPASAEVIPALSADGRPAVTPEGKADDFLFSNDKITVSNAYPNPADESTEIDYQFTSPGDARLTMLSVLGTPVGEFTLEQGDRKLRINTRTLSTGYYLYQLSVDGRKVATKRLLVRHQ